MAHLNYSVRWVSLKHSKTITTKTPENIKNTQTFLLLLDQPISKAQIRFLWFIPCDTSSYHQTPQHVSHLHSKRNVPRKTIKVTQHHSPTRKSNMKLAASWISRWRTRPEYSHTNLISAQPLLDWPLEA